MIDNYNPDTPTENDLINEYARSSLEDWHDEEWAERDKAAARRRIAKIKADAWDEGAIAAATELDGPEYWLPPEDKFPNPYRGQR